MDTDDLSQEAYEAVIIEAERFNHDLTSQFGLLSSECKNEKEYLEKSILLIHELKKIKPGEFEDIFFDVIPNKKDLNKALDTILANIENVKKIPEKKRHFDL